MPEITHTSSDPGIARPSTFRVVARGHRHRELDDVRAFERRFGVPVRYGKQTRYRVDYDRVQAFKRASISASKLQWLAENANARPFGLRVPDELKAPADCGAYGSRRALSSHDLIALGWVFTATMVYGAPALLTTHARLGELLGLKACMTGRRMRRLCDLGLISRLPMYLPKLELEERDESTGRRKQRPRRKGQGIAYAPTELALRLFAVDRDRQDRRRVVRRRQKAVDPVREYQVTSEGVSIGIETPSDARVARGKVSPSATVDRRLRRETRPNRASTASSSKPSSGPAAPPPSPDPAAPDKARPDEKPVPRSSGSVFARAAQHEAENKQLRRQLASLIADRERTRVASESPTRRFVCDRAERGMPRLGHCSDCDRALSDDKTN